MPSNSKNEVRKTRSCLLIFQLSTCCLIVKNFCVPVEKSTQVRDRVAKSSAAELFVLSGEFQVGIGGVPPCFLSLFIAFVVFCAVGSCDKQGFGASGHERVSVSAVSTKKIALHA